jgi:2'-5' RNA ligase
MFCAFELPESLRSRIEEHSRKLREAVPEAVASWSRPENIHLTVKFFGSVERTRVDAISVALERVSKAFAAFPIVVGKSGVFTRRAEVLWIGISDPSGTLLELQQQLENECAREGFPKEARVYRPHLTIARLRKPQHARLLAQTHLDMDFSSAEVMLSELVLFRSELSSKGSKYTAISRHRLEH